MVVSTLDYSSLESGGQHGVPPVYHVCRQASVRVQGLNQLSELYYKQSESYKSVNNEL